jgi:hypothetical protein
MRKILFPFFISAVLIPELWNILLACLIMVIMTTKMRGETEVKGETGGEGRDSCIICKTKK